MHVHFSPIQQRTTSVRQPALVLAPQKASSPHTHARAYHTHHTERPPRTQVKICTRQGFGSIILKERTPGGQLELRLCQRAFRGRRGEKERAPEDKKDPARTPDRARWAAWDEVGPRPPPPTMRCPARGAPFSFRNRRHKSGEAHYPDYSADNK